MMEYTNKYWKMIMPLVKKSLTKRFGKEETALLVQKTDAIYRDMLNRSDDIGKDNPMASNLYECLIFLALWKAADGKISVDGLRGITHEVMGFPIMKAVGIFMNANRSGLDKLEKRCTRMQSGWKFTRSTKSFHGISTLIKPNIRRDSITISPDVR